MGFLFSAFLHLFALSCFFAHIVCNGHLVSQINSVIRVPSSLKLDFAGQRISMDVDMSKAELIEESVRINEVLGRVEFVDGNVELWKAGLSALNRITEWASRIALDNRRHAHVRSKFESFRNTAVSNRNHIASLVALREGTAGPNFCYDARGGSSSSWRRSRNGTRSSSSKYLQTKSQRIELECYREELRCIYGIHKERHCMRCSEWCGRAARCATGKPSSSLVRKLAKKSVYCLRNGLYCSVHRCMLQTDALYIVLRTDHS